ncbi:MAG: RNA polymerase sigma factor [Bacteroidetes bacterium]|nr:RNA polymerase sigma factor [Bacteroidota bacterium]
MTTAEYNKCVDDHSDGVYRFILKNIKDEDKAKDVVQDSFVKMWDKVSEISYEKSRSYLFTTAYHTMIDTIRRDKKSSSFEEISYNAHSDSKEYLGLKEILNEAVSRLPEIQRSVVLLRDYEGYSYEEIGEITNLSESQVKVYIYRARVFLKEYIGCLENVI